MAKKLTPDSTERSTKDRPSQGPDSDSVKMRYSMGGRSPRNKVPVNRSLAGNRPDRNPTPQALGIASRKGRHNGQEVG
jgi:hypothetical protein